MTGPAPSPLLQLVVLWYQMFNENSELTHWQATYFPDTGKRKGMRYAVEHVGKNERLEKEGERQKEMSGERELSRVRKKKKPNTMSSQSDLQSLCDCDNGGRLAAPL